MNKKTIIVVVLVVAAALGLMWFGRPSRSGTANVSSVAPGKAGAAIEVGPLSAAEGSFDFGTISMSAGKVAHSFKVTNVGVSPVTLVKLYTSCMCTTAYFVNGSDPSIGSGQEKLGPFGMEGMGGMTELKQTIPPQGTRDVEVVYDPAAHGPAGIGSIDRLVYIMEASGSMLQLEIKAFVTP